MLIINNPTLTLQSTETSHSHLNITVEYFFKQTSKSRSDSGSWCNILICPHLSICVHSAGCTVHHLPCKAVFRPSEREF